MSADVPPTAEKDARHTVAEAIALWERNGPTSFTVAVMADALYGVREGVHALASEFRAGGVFQQTGWPGEVCDRLEALVETSVFPPGEGRA